MRFLGLRFELDAAGHAALTPGPVVVLCRHVNIVDASLPALLCQQRGLRTGGVIMADLLADPGFDLIYAQTGSTFIPRDNGPEAIAAVRQMARDLDATTAIAIFPEGRLFRPDRLQRALARLATDNPERAPRLATLRHVLPPRPGGVLALVDTIPADVVVIAHAGLEPYPSFTDLARNAAPARPDPRHRLADPTPQDPRQRNRPHRLARPAMATHRRLGRRTLGRHVIAALPDRVGWSGTGLRGDTIERQIRWTMPSGQAIAPSSFVNVTKWACTDVTFPTQRHGGQVSCRPSTALGQR